MFKDVSKMFKLEHLIRIGQSVIVLLVLLFMFSCSTIEVVTDTVTTVDTVYKDTTIYTYIKKDSVILTNSIVEKDTIIYVDSIATRVRIRYTDMDLYMETISDTVGIAYAEAWVAKSVLNLKVVQLDTTLQFKLDSALLDIHTKDSIITVIQKTKKDSKMKDVKHIMMLLIVLAGMIIAYKLFR